MSLFPDSAEHNPGGKSRLPLLPGVSGTALFGGSNKCYRYLLTRYWGSHQELPFALFIGMNPSTAGDDVDDPTIRREIALTLRLKLSVYRKCNVSAYRSTDPKHLSKAGAPLHTEENFSIILRYAVRAEIVVMACGNLPQIIKPVGRKLVEELSRFNVPLFCLGQTKDGYPKHPLYLKRDVPIVLWQGSL